MRHKDNLKVVKRALKYVVINKITNKVIIFRYKTQISDLISVSTRTLDRGLPYETVDYVVYRVSSVVL